MHVHIHICVFVPGPQEEVWRGLTGLSSVLSSGADDSLGSWSPLLGPDGVSPDTEKDRTLTKLLCASVLLMASYSMTSSCNKVIPHLF